MNMVSAADGTIDYSKIFGAFGYFIEFIILLLPTLFLLTFFFLGYLIFSSENISRKIKISCIGIMVLIALDLMAIIYLSNNVNPIWLEAFAGWSSIIILLATVVLSYLVYRRIEGKNKKVFRYLYITDFVLCTIWIVIVVTMLLLGY
jgi:hypothetical protein